MNTLPLSAWMYIPLGCSLILGLLLFVRGLFHDRSRGRLRCPRCWYDMSGSNTFRCPECGHECSQMEELRGTRRRIPMALTGLFLVVPTLCFFAYRDGARVWYSLPPKWKETQVIRANGVVARSMKLRDPSERGGRLTLSSDGRSILDLEDYATSLGLPLWDPESPKAPPKPVGAGDDFNGDGIREVLLTQYSGGAHCCYIVTLVEMSESPRVIATIDAINGMSAHTLPSGEVVLNVPDQSFDYWNAPHISSPFPNVYYRLTNHRLEIAMDLMLAQAEQPSQQELETESAALRASIVKVSGAQDSKLWRIMLELLYKGRESEAWSFFDACWPESVPGKAEFKADFLKILESDRAWGHFAPALAAYRSGEPLPGAEF